MHKEGPRLSDEKAVMDMRRDLEVRLADLESRIALLRQHNDHNQRHACDRGHQVDDLQDRLDATERVQVTRSGLDQRFRRAIALLSLLAAAASAVAALLAVLLSR
ncbi:hypothetical protein [Actinomadura fibrosa]|uniref:DUF3618 domain-containing protein n=1 Tax=Actinomadura fibrosa TaxID=111802 RepID=A0ABW2XV62_9ACTN|nr:hypothetical protein [Actinomadura fibrosa]